MRFLITNDDGIDAPGLRVLVRLAVEFGDAMVVAPAVCHSAKSHAVTMVGALRVEPREGFDGVPAFACSGTPADCVRMGLHRMNAGEFDIVLSGINPGANLGVDVFYSGTVAAAREAGLLGHRGVAVSQLVRKGSEVAWDDVRERAAQALRFVLDRAENLPPVTNVNLPAPRAGGPPLGVRICPLTLDPWPMTYSQPSQDGDGTAFETDYIGSYLDRRCVAGADFQLVKDDYITITPLRLDATDDAGMQRFATSAKRG